MPRPRLNNEVRAYRDASPWQSAMTHLGKEAYRAMGAIPIYKSGGRNPRLKIVERGEIVYQPSLLEKLGNVNIEHVPRRIETRMPEGFREPLRLKPLRVVLLAPYRPSPASKHILAIQFSDERLGNERFAVATAAGDEGPLTAEVDPKTTYNMAIGLVEPEAAQQRFAEELGAVLPDRILFDPGFVTLKTA